MASLLSLLAAVAVARFRFRFRASFLVMLLIVQMLPQQALVIALFLDFERLDLLQSLVGLIIVYTALALPVSIWMLRNFVATVPRELEEAAAIDGAGRREDLLADPVPAGRARPGGHQHVRVHLRLQRVHRGADVPRPGDTANYTLPIYVTYFFGRGGADWGPIMAASTLFTIPVVIFFLIVRRRLVGGLIAGAVKG